jgi:lipopolysaccharide export system protein LptA
MNPLHQFSLGAVSLLGGMAIALSPHTDRAIAQSQSRALTLRADVQEANAKTGVVTARGNVIFSYPARQVQATAATAQYFSREKRVVLSGGVVIKQEGNSLKCETATYLIAEGRFIALPQANRQVEAVYYIEDAEAPTSTPPPPEVPPFNPKPAFKTPQSSSQ